MQANIHVYIMPIANSILTSTKQQTTMTSASMYVLHVCVCVCVWCACQLCTCACVCLCMPICVCVWRVCACLCACVHVHVSLFVFVIASRCNVANVKSLAITKKGQQKGQHLYEMSNINRLHTESTCIENHRRHQPLHLLEILTCKLDLLLLELCSGCP